MKLTKNKLLKVTKDNLEELGYKYIIDTQTGASGLFIKLMDEGYFLTLGLIISRLYDTKFTAAFYLSKTTRWGAVWGDIPKESYERIGTFLTTEERKSLLEERYTQEGVIDTWWNGNNKEEITNFFKTVELTEKRFLSQENLLFKIQNSSEVSALVNYSTNVIALITHGNVTEQYNYEFIPNKPVDQIPLDWFRAAEIILLKQKGILNGNTVKLLAVDAWRQYRIKLE